MSEPRPTVELKSPERCTAEELAEFRDIVLKEREVRAEGFEGRIKRAEKLAFLRLGDAIVGVGALKRPHRDYAVKVFKSAKASADSRRFELELGWVVVVCGHRGNKYSNLIVEAIRDYANGALMYATSVTARTTMHAALRAYGFERDGGEWPSEREDRPGEKLYLFVHHGDTAVRG